MFLKYQYHRYHLAGIIIYLIGVILYSIIDNVFITRNIFNTGQYFLYIGLMIIGQFLGGFLDCGEKYLMEYKYINPFIIVFLEGLSGTLIMIILLVSISYMKCTPESSFFCNDYGYVESFGRTIKYIFTHSYYALLFSCFLIFIFLTNTFRILINEHYSPVHRGISNTISPCFKWILRVTIPFFHSANQISDLSYYFGISFSYIFMIIGVLIFLQVILINCCNISHNIREEIIKRETQDIALLRGDKKEGNDMRFNELGIYD